MINDFLLSSGDINLSLSFSSEFIFAEVFETLIILSAIFLPIKSPVASSVFRIALFEAVLSASVAGSLT